MRFAAAARPAHMAVEAHAARDCRTMLEDALPYSRLSLDQCLYALRVPQASERSAVTVMVFRARPFLAPLLLPDRPDPVEKEGRRDVPLPGTGFPA